MIELTEQQEQAIASVVNPTIFDLKTQTTYALIRQEVFERIKDLFYDDSDLSHNELRSLLAGSM